MDPQSFSIQPSPIMITKFRIASINIQPLQNSAWINVELMNDEVVKLVSLQMSGQDYIEWGSDTPYLVNWICSKLNYQLL
jgi:hypothetical protein